MWLTKQQHEAGGGEAQECFSVLSYALARQVPSMTRHEQSLALESQVLETKGLNLRVVEFFLVFYLLIYFEIFNESTCYFVWCTCHGAGIEAERRLSGWLQMLYHQDTFLALLSIVLFCSSDYEGAGARKHQAILIELELQVACYGY